MNEIVKVDYVNNEPIVSGRELHEALKIETPYRIWFPRMCEYGFVEGKDYTPYIFVHPQNKQETTDHRLTLDMAKELCMIQRTTIGKRCREYFIEVEKAWNDPVLIMGRAYEAQKAINEKLTEKLMCLEAKAVEDRPKVLFAEAVETSHTSILVGDLAKLLKQNGVDIGQKRLFKWLRENGYLMKGGASKNMPTQRAADMGLFEIKERTVNNPDGTVMITKTTKVTGKGQTYFVAKFLDNKEEEGENIRKKV